MGLLLRTFLTKRNPYSRGYASPHRCIIACKSLRVASQILWIPSTNFKKGSKWKEVLDCVAFVINGQEIPEKIDLD